VFEEYFLKFSHLKKSGLILIKVAPIQTESTIVSRFALQTLFKHLPYLMIRDMETQQSCAPQFLIHQMFKAFLAFHFVTEKLYDFEKCRWQTNKFYQHCLPYAGLVRN